MLAKEKFREGWVRIRVPHKYGESDEILQPFSLLYAFFHKDVTNRQLKEEHKELRDAIEEAIESGTSSMFSNLPHEYIKGFNESERNYVRRMKEVLYYIDTTESFFEEVHVETIVETYIQGFNDSIIPVKLYERDYSICSQELVEEAIQGEDWMMKVVNPRYFETKTSKDKIHYLRSRGIPKERAIQMMSSGAKDAAWFKPREGILYTMCRPHHIIYGDSDYCEEFDTAMKEMPKKRSDELRLPLN